MLHVSENWLVNKDNELKLQRAEVRVIRWICGTERQRQVYI